MKPKQKNLLKDLKKHSLI